jgi:glutaredoxin
LIAVLRRGTPEMERNSDQFDDQTIDTNSLILVTAGWCPFTANAKSFWNDAASKVGMPLKVVDLDEAEGEQIAQAAGVQGVPCLLIPGGQSHYGLGLSREEAEQFLRERAELPTC